MTLNDRLEEAGFDIDDSDLKNAVKFEDDLDDCIVGVACDDRFVYDYDKMVECYMKLLGYDEIDAIDHIEYGIIRFYNQFGEKSPIIFHNV